MSDCSHHHDCAYDGQWKVAKEACIKRTGGKCGICGQRDATQGITGRIATTHAVT